MPLDPLNEALQHLAHLAGFEVPEPLPRQLSTRLVPSPIEEDRVQVRIETQIEGVRRSAPESRIAHVRGRDVTGGGPGEVASCATVPADRPALAVKS